MRDIVADPCQRFDEALHLVEHAVDDDGELAEGIITVSVRQSFTQVTGDDALDALVNLHDTPAGSGIQRHADHKAKQHGGN